MSFAELEFLKHNDPWCPQVAGLMILAGIINYEIEGLRKSDILPVYISGRFHSYLLNEVNPSRMANLVSSAMLYRPSFFMMLWRWFSMVFRLTLIL
jgi:hypothetical protein